MVLQHNIASLSAYNQAKQNDNQLQKDIARLSTGYRINSAADDASGLAVSEKLRAKITGLTRAQQNTLDGVSFVQFADAVLQEVHSILNRMLSLSLQSMNDTYTGEERNLLENEHLALKEEIDRIGQSAKFNGMPLFDGVEAIHIDGTERLGSEFTMHVGETEADYHTIKVILEKMNSKTLGISASTIATQLAAEAAIKNMKNAINMVSEDRGRLGAIQNRLGHADRSIGVSIENMVQAESRIRDLDMARAMMDYTKHKILTETAIAMISQASSMSARSAEVLSSAASGASSGGESGAHTAEVGGAAKAAEGYAAASGSSGQMSGFAMYS